MDIAGPHASSPAKGSARSWLTRILAVAWQPRTGDALVVALTAVPVLAGVIGRQPTPATAPWTLLVLIPLWWRRTSPDLTMALLVAAGAAQLAFTDSVTYADAAMLVALYAVARYGTRWRSLGWLLVVLAGSAAAAVDWARDEIGYVSPQLHRQSILTMAAMLVLLAVLTWTIGRLMRSSHALLAERARAREERHAQEIRLAVLAERGQIAREVHDIVGHALTLVAVQAEGARYVASAPEVDLALSAQERLSQAGDALENIRTIASQALDETRCLVRDLTPDRADSRSPLPGLADLPGLVTETRRAGHDADLDPATIDLADITATAQVTLYRVAQEALTNAVRHAPGSRIRVALTRTRENVTLRVVNDDLCRSAAPEASDTGRGLTGMRERVRALGGGLRIERTPAAEFVVEATLPLSHEERGEAP